MSEASGGKGSTGMAVPGGAPRAGSERGGPPVVRLDVAGYDGSQQAALGTGTQHNYFGGMAAESEAETVVSIALPAGLRDERFPLRGRDKLLSELLAVHDGPGVRVLHGMGGCGKTTLALEAGYFASQRGSEVWWVSAAEEFRFLAGMRALGRRLGMTDDELRHGEAADLLWRRLSGWSEEWLLVIDNADDPQILAGTGFRTAEGRGWLRPVTSRLGLVLVTSRDGRAGSWGPWCRLYSTGVLDVENAALVLADRTRAHHDGLGGDMGAESLADRLGRLPLALRIAGSFLAELAEIPPAFADTTPIRSYLEYRETLEQGDLDTVFPSSGPTILTLDHARGIIDRTWEITLDQLESHDFPEARKLLRLLACFADAPIPYELLLHPPTLATSPLFADITGLRLWQVLQSLAQFSLIELADGQDQGAPRVVRLHPLIRDTSRAKRVEKDEYLALAASLVRTAAISESTGSPEDPHAWPRWQILAPHASYIFETLIASAGCRDEVLAAAADAADNAASYQASQGFIRLAEATHRAVLQVRLRTVGADHPSTIDTRHSIARRISEHGDYGHAETEFRDVLVAMQRVLGPEHPKTLGVQHNIASIVSFRGDFAQAETEYRDVLEIKLRIFDPDHREVLAARHEIARMLSEEGRHTEAEIDFRRVLEAKVRALGPDHYDTLITRSQLARTMAAQGQHTEAEKEFREILAAQVRLLGPEHLRTLWTRQQIALMMASRGDYTGAEQELYDVLARREPRIPDHPDTLAARHELARMLIAKGNKSEAYDAFQDVLIAKLRVLGPHHPSTVLTICEIDSLSAGHDTPP
jgi:tetratricopeptide (TPR) repeat protein